jgi:cob(I)alamin adenosyltransferase
MDWKIYTKKGDKGQTSLLGGRQVPKFHPKIEAYGTIDELNSFVGLLRDQHIDSHYKMVLLKIQEQLFTAESIIAKDLGAENITLPQIKECDIIRLEKEIDKMNEKLPPLGNFILPGGHPAISYAHVARTVCRRAERIITQLDAEEQLDEIIIRYFNRLSDYFFVLARKIGSDLGVQDQIWKPE